MKAVIAAVALGLAAGAALAQDNMRKEYDDGSVYEGSFRNGVQHGHGIYTKPNGYRFEGDFVEGAI